MKSYFNLILYWLAQKEAAIPPLHIIWMKIGALQFLSVLISIFYRGQMPLSIDCYWHFKRAISDFLVFSTTIHIIANSPLLTQSFGHKKIAITLWNTRDDIFATKMRQYSFPLTKYFEQWILTSVFCKCCIGVVCCVFCIKHLFIYYDDIQ